jgi:hypothetical protein
MTNKNSEALYCNDCKDDGCEKCRPDYAALLSQYADHESNKENDRKTRLISGQEADETNKQL